MLERLYEPACLVQLALYVDGRVTLAAVAALYLVLKHVRVLTAYMQLRNVAVVKRKVNLIIISVQQEIRHNMLAAVTYRLTQ